MGVRHSRVSGTPGSKRNSTPRLSLFEKRSNRLNRSISVAPTISNDVRRSFTLLESYSIAFVATDNNHNVIFCNSGAETLLSMNAKLMQGLHINELFFGWNKQWLNQANGKFTLVTKGIMKKIEASYSFMEDGGSTIIMYHLNELIDERTVKLLQTLNQTVLQAACIPIIIMDSNCIVKEFNSAAEKVFGYSKQEVSNINILMPIETARCHDQIVADYVSKGSNTGDKTRNVTGIRKNGSAVQLELTVRQIRVSENYLLFVGIARDRELLITQNEQSDRSKLALEIFPPNIAQRITDGEKFIHDVHENVSILFCDIVGFTTISALLDSETIVTLINAIFTAIDRCVLDSRHLLEKIKTIGDCYMIVSGLSGSSDHANEAVQAAYKMLTVIDTINQEYRDILPPDQPIQLRIGINSGEVVAGIAGETKPCYDVWGSSVNIASRLESTGLPGRIQISAATYEQLSDSNKKRFRLRQGVQLKGVGLVDTFVTNSHR